MDSEERSRLEARLDLVDALLDALGSWPEIGETVWRSAGRGEAVEALMQRFGFDERVTHFLLDMPLGRTHTSARAELAEEAAELRRTLSTG